MNNGWDYKTEITPENLPKVQTLQTIYLQNYTNAYNKMMREFLIDKDDEYAVKFNKSKFLDLKKFKIKHDLIKYYKPMNFYIKGPFILIKNENTLKYCIELCWKN